MQLSILVNPYVESVSRLYFGKSMNFTNELDIDNGEALVILCLKGLMQHAFGFGITLAKHQGILQHLSCGFFSSACKLLS